MNKTYTNYNTKGFSLVEIIIVIVVVSLLATITSVSYAGIRRRADIESVKSDLLAVSSRLATFKSNNGTYPATIDCNQSNSDTNLCVKASKDDITFHYNTNTTADTETYGLTAVKNNVSNISYRTVAGSEPILCPIGFIVVPGSKTYSTGNFCIMKYEAKRVGTTELPESVPAGLPWTSVNQTKAIEYSRNACSECHLITEAEWMTLAQNVLSVPSNWSGNAVGSGFIYSGHNDNVPANSLAADASDTNGYSGTGQTTGSNQRRTLTLTNGEVIWDMAGNVAEWTSGQTTGNQPGIATAGFAWRQWNALTVPGSLAVNSTPTGTGLTGANTWSSTQGIGQIYSNTGDAQLRGFLRGGAWNNPGNAGVLALYLSAAPSDVGTTVGFRVASSAP